MMPWMDAYTVSYAESTRLEYTWGGGSVCVCARACHIEEGWAGKAGHAVRVCMPAGGTMWPQLYPTCALACSATLVFWKLKHSSSAMASMSAGM